MEHLEAILEECICELKYQSEKSNLVANVVSTTKVKNINSLTGTARSR